MSYLSRALAYICGAFIVMFLLGLFLGTALENINVGIILGLSYGVGVTLGLGIGAVVLNFL
jgi:hypothetical protein